MNNLVKGINLVLIILVMTGCSKAVIKSDADPSVNFASINKFYVQKFPADNRGLEKIIADKINELGFQATSGIDAMPSEPVDAIVTYKDRWMWDITTYMMEISIEMLNPDSKYMFASGKSFRTSLVRKPPEFMIEEVLRDIFSGKVELPEKNRNNKGE